MEAEDADILVLTETKASARPGSRILGVLKLLYDRSTMTLWTRSSPRDTPIATGQYRTRRRIVSTAPVYGARSSSFSTAGTAILSKIKPLGVDYTLPGHPDPKSVKGRIVTLEFDNTYVVGTYVVNAGTGLKVNNIIPTTWNTHLCPYRP